MKVESENRKLKFLSQLRKHLKSPGVEKMLGRKKHRIKRKRRDELKRKATIPLKTSPKRSLQCRMIRRAGEQLKESLQRFWDCDEIQEKRCNLINYAIKSNEVVTASKVVTQEDVKKHSSSQQSVSDENVSSESPAKKYDPEVKSRSSLQSSSSKDFYIHCSSAESSCPSTPKRQPGCNDKPSVEPTHLKQEGECSHSGQPIVRASVPKTIHPEAFDDKSSSFNASNTSIQATIEPSFPEPTADDRNYNEVAASDCAGALHPSENKYEFDFNVSEKLHQNADKLIEEVAKGLSSYSKKDIVADPVRLHCGSNSDLVTSHIDYDLSPRRYPERPGYAASTGRVKSSVLTKETFNREISSDQMFRFRSHLLGSHESDKEANSSSARRRSFTYASPEPLTKKSIFLSSSDSDSDNEILVRMRMATRRQDVTMGFIPSAQRQFIPPITSRMFNDAAPSLSDSDSSFSPYEKPCFLH